jgi:L,D-transpeptidase catalytic domain
MKAALRNLSGLALLAFLCSSASGSLPAQSDLEQSLIQQAPKINPEILDLALRSYVHAEQEGLVDRKGILTIIDYSRLSSEKRLWTFDLQSRRMLFEDLVAHGKNSGENKTVAVSNAFESRMSSVGVYKTGEPYIGKNGYSLRLIGLEDGFNTNAFARAVVLHGAWYVSDEMIKSYGRIGRSWGCPAVRKEIATPLIDTIKDGSLLVIYYPNDDWLEHSSFLNASLQK